MDLAAAHGYPLKKASAALLGLCSLPVTPVGDLPEAGPGRPWTRCSTALTERERLPVSESSPLEMAVRGGAHPARTWQRQVRRGAAVTRPRAVPPAGPDHGAARLARGPNTSLSSVPSLPSQDVGVRKSVLDPRARAHRGALMSPRPPVLQRPGTTPSTCWSPSRPQVLLSLAASASRSRT